MNEQQTTILIIEDNADVRENLAEILDLCGYRTLTAPNGLAGAKVAIEHLPDLILCDVMMPELDGFGVLNLLSDNPRTSALPFVFITARTEAEDIRRGMNLGADDYITKPFYKDELLQVIRTRLRKGAARAPAAPPLHLSDPDRGKELLDTAFITSGTQKEYEPGTTLVREGEFPHFLYRVTEGRVHLSRTHAYGRDYIIAEVGPGELFGIPSVLERAPYHYTARAAGEAVTCGLLPAATLLQLLNTDRSVSEALLHLLARRSQRDSEHLVNQAYDSVRRRTALVLCDLREHHGEEPIVLSREELAQMVGSTKESVTRALSDFRREKLVTTDGKGIRIIAPAELRNLLV
ncbi:MAG: response regulator [Lewinella sp.]